MKNHGLVLLALVSLADVLAAQNSGPAYIPPSLPPSPRTMVTPSLQPPQTLPAPPLESLQPFDVDAEIQQFRNELRQFQSSVEDASRNVKATDQNGDRISAEQRQELIDLMTKLARKGRRRQEPNVVRQVPTEPRITEPLPIVAKPAESAVTIELNSEPQIGDSVDADMEALSESESELEEAIDEAAEASKPLDPNNPLVTSDIADAFALGKVLFRNGDFVNAEKAFRKAVVEPENEMTLKYLTATCMRRQKRWRRATEMYQIVATSDKDPILQKLAKWQIENIRWQQESEAQLKQLRQQRENQTPPKKSASVESSHNKR